MFPFRGMPVWAQWIGEVLPLTHFLRIIRGVMLKGNVPYEVWPNLWPIAAFMLAAMALAMLRYRRTGGGLGGKRAPRLIARCPRPSLPRSVEGDHCAELVPPRSLKNASE